jgi:hypothetical protein
MTGVKARSFKHIPPSNLGVDQRRGGAMPPFLMKPFFFFKEYGGELASSRDVHQCFEQAAFAIAEIKLKFAKSYLEIWPRAKMIGILPSRSLKVSSCTGLVVYLGSMHMMARRTLRQTPKTAIDRTRRVSLVMR